MQAPVVLEMGCRGLPYFGEGGLEKVSYDEAREWFWVRTLVWTVAAAIVSVMGYFAFSNDVVKVFGARVWVSAGAGVGVTLIGVLAAYISLQFPWMRGGWRFGFVLNGPVSAAIAALISFLLGGMILTFMQNDNVHPPPATLIDMTYALMKFGIAASALWGFIYGSWFAMRRDRYFVESI